ncbi:dethiobiotin synthetase BioD [Gottschalkia acidurici 9a]|uniref:ATP-dependent dethiobiotin synthetase BioD n=1 Tax=Gottschalkia acidurici (strain ATCC 7906 / DSM 604 / BCRC 14475 / CIP 104303 / KCTC 5404 / NCIMB 10678 / 9a) TaxID=1128398 RepID=K0B2Z7_GOTA9|nr:dethiobiotin synthase [Gottschalkia acidurici]AFS79547.1 dethiobiotin synthetase BioD [Gottschalkia acidurici 9a]
MAKSIFIVGTGTNIGKTFVSGGIMHILNKHGINVGYLKPVQSGVYNGEDSSISDVDFIKEISTIKQDKKDMNAYSFKKPLSPHLAAKMENVLVDKSRIIKQYKKLENQYDYIVIEGAGGTIVPLTPSYYIYDLIKDMNTSVMVVANAGVGTINHTCLTIDFLKRQGIIVNGIIINKYTGQFYEDDNIKTIEDISRVEVKGVINKLDKKNMKFNDENLKVKIREIYEKSLSIDKVLSIF